MIRLKDTNYQKTSDLLENAVRIAEYYGFAPIDEVPRAPRDPKREGTEPEISIARREERALMGSARRVLACMRPEHGTLLTWRLSSPVSSVPAVSFELHIMGNSSMIAEALLIVVAQAIAREAGVAEPSLAINNIGGGESSGRYVRDVGTYLRKHLDSITPALRERAASDPIGTLVQLIERGHPAVPRAPQAMEYLTEDERRRFWELLEYLETAGVAYELNPQILGSRDCWSNTLFEIASQDQETGARVPFALGGRYDPLASRFKRAPEKGVMVSIAIEARGKVRARRRDIGIPLIYFTHLGSEARRRAIPVLEVLRQASIPVHHGLWYERMGDQMQTARNLAVPYILILGHKEAMEGTVLVREVASNSQQAVPVAELPGYLKRRRVLLNAPMQTSRG